MSDTLKVLLSKNWSHHTCQSCGRRFASKHSDDLVCGWRKCSSYKPTQSNQVQKKGRFVSVTEVLGRFRSYFESQGMVESVPCGISDGFNTELMSAGVQIFSKEFGGLADFTERKTFVAQPCIRGSSGGSLLASGSSFVNVCSEATSLSQEDHFNLVDLWVGFFSSIGLHASRLKLVHRDKKENWGFGDFESEQIFFVYMGEELGEASYSHQISTSEKSSLSDIGFGLERITWAVNWFRCDYTNLISNPGLSGSPEMHDLARTTSLLIYSGITSDTKGPGGILRKLLKRTSQMCSKEEFLASVVYYKYFWEQFHSTLEVEYEQVLSIIEKEFDRKKIDALKSHFGVDSRNEMTLVELAEYLMYNRGIRYEEIQCHIQLEMVQK